MPEVFNCAESFKTPPEPAENARFEVDLRDSRPQSKGERTDAHPLLSKLDIVGDAAQKASPGSEPSSITLSPEHFDRLSPEIGTFLRQNKVERVSLVRHDGVDTLVVELPDEISQSLDPSQGCRKVTLGKRLRCDIARGANGSLEISNIKGISAEVDPGNDPILGIPLPWVTASLNKVSITVGPDGRASTKVTGGWGKIEKSVSVDLDADNVGKLQGLIARVDELRKTGNTALASRVPESELLKEEPEQSSWLATVGKVLGAIAAAYGTKRVVERLFPASKGPAAPVAPDVLEKVALDLPRGFNEKDALTKVDELIVRERSKGEDGDAKMADKLESLKKQIEGNPKARQSLHEALVKTQTEMSKPAANASLKAPEIVSNRPLESISSATGRVVDGVVASTVTGDRAPALPADVAEAIEKERSELSRKLSELDRLRETDPRNEDIAKRRAELARQMEDLAKAQSDPSMRGKVTEWLRANGSAAGKGVGAAALFLFIYSACASQARADDRAGHARLSK